MKLAPYIACICERSAETAIIDVLVDNNLLIFTREDMPEENVITAPEIEMLIIHSEGAYERFKRSGKKPSEFCKADLRMHNVKSYDFVKDYFSNPQTLVNAIKEYRRTANIPKGEYSLSDLLK
jgi:hypothetical protein